ncbi:Spermidine/putrescine transport system permease protein PotB [Jeotgalicoccus saudimassiliensis]|uniref:Spermidine/putrescine transport system permease protein PotB n=1 Tax=Jeotgalicoccus saudimassiliensis TaxID=1461582 RepID=A0A078LZ45_9STAP|nr:ABC transporter permease [Jeotgalicoccus saudimassiliensis]CDZ99319.1 Spermidine/putrescine transport system permease protein PotB [Jeotgalicoccus saudimassiliensis]
MKRLIAVPYFIWMLLFVIVPLLLMTGYSFIDLSGNITLGNYAAFLSENYIKMTVSSFWYAFLITLFTLLVSYPLALVISSTKRKAMWLLIIILPTWINLLLKTYAFIGIFGRRGVVNDIAAYIGLGEFPLLFSDAAFIIVSVYIFMPFMLLPVFNAIDDIDNNLLSAAKDLGANSMEVLFKMIMPLSLEGVKTGVQVVFIPSLSLFMITRLITGNKVITLGTAIEQQFLTNENWGMGSTIGVFLILIMLIVMIFTGGSRKQAGKI